MPDSSAGYLLTPTIRGPDVVFVCDDDLWLVHADGGRAHRLTAGVGAASGPRISPDGEHIAFVGRDEGPPDVYLMPARGGDTLRLTHLGGLMGVAGFDPVRGDVLFATDAERPFFRDRWLYRVGLAGGVPEQLPLGPAGTISFAPSGGGAVLGRNVDDPARWKRYRGGRVGDLWVARDGGAEYQRLVHLPGNLAAPCWVADRIYFIADHEGVGNVYSCLPSGEDLRRHTDHDDYYARNLSSDGRRLVYHAGARLWLLDPESAGPVPIEVRLGSARPQRGRHFSDPGRHLDTVSLDPDGAGIALTSRGKALALGAWAGPVRRYGQPDGVRYRLLATLAGQGRLVAVASDDGETERVVVFAARGDTTGTGCSDVDTGRAVELVPSPTEEVAALTNHRNELLLVDLRPEQPRTTVLDSSRYGQIADPAWSPDGRWLAYTYPTSPNSSAIRLVEPATGTVTDATRPVLADRCPAFDPAGRYLYFIGHRDFDPVYDEQRFDLGFPLGSRPYAVTLRADVPAPFVAQAQAPGTGTGAGTDKSTVDSKEKGEPAAPAPVDIDLAGITRRVVAFPVPLGRYERVAGTAEKVFFSSYPVTGTRNRSDDPPVDRTIDCLDLSTLECELYTAGVTDFGIGADHSTMLLRCDERLRVVKAGEKLGDADRPGRVSGWIDLDRVTISVRPQAEWRQMFREAWRLQRENFWVEDMSGVDWAEVYQRYLPLVDRVGTRAEFSDLLWELQGELGTSHATEYGGAYRYRPHYRQGTLGVDWAQPVRPGEAGDGQRIARVLEGDVWDRDATSPLNRPGVDVRAGDEILAVAGIPVGGPVTVASLLVNLAEQEVELLVRRGGEPPREVTVRTLADERAARYRDWVVANRDLVHERTGGRVGYVHLPDMGPAGFGEFFRGYLAEFDREALVVDVRFNRGGHVSALLLEHLARRRLAYAYARWGAPAPYPDEAVRGPLVAVTNENAGSDGDIFSHAFKAMGLGPLVGKRTWGGVIGIWPRHRLADGTVTTQPEFSFAFDDVGWRVENYGTDPTIEVDNTPQDHARGVDAQLERAIEVVLAELAVHPAHTPNPLDRPRLDRTPLPPR